MQGPLYFALSSMVAISAAAPAFAQDTLWHSSFGANKKCVLLVLNEDNYSYEFGDCGGTYVAPSIEEPDQRAAGVPIKKRNDISEVVIQTHEDMEYTFAIDPNQSGNKLTGNWSGPTGSWQGSMYQKRCADSSLCD